MRVHGALRRYRKLSQIQMQISVIGVAGEYSFATVQLKMQCPRDCWLDKAPQVIRLSSLWVDGDPNVWQSRVPREPQYVDNRCHMQACSSSDIRNRSSR